MAAVMTLPFLILSLLAITTAAGSTTTTTSNIFIQSKCISTTYPLVCIQSLSSYANKINKSPRQLAQTALSVSLAKARYAKARYTKAYVAKLGQSKGLRPREAGALRDCMEMIGDTVDRLGKSVHEFQMAAQARRGDFRWHMSNVQTWASAALTDENTCVDGFQGRALNGRMKFAIKKQFKDVLQCTSNALALVNQFADKYSP